MNWLVVSGAQHEGSLSRNALMQLSDLCLFLMHEHASVRRVARLYTATAN